MNARIKTVSMFLWTIILVLAACSRNDTGAQQRSSPGDAASSVDIYGHSASYSFETSRVGALPEGFKTGMTGQWRKTEWRIERVESNAMLAHVGFWDEDPDGVFPLAWVQDARARDLRLTVRLFPVDPPDSVKGAVHDGAGIVVRLLDEDNYYLLRLVPLETRVRFYKVENGRRSTLAGRDVAVPSGHWYELQLTADGSHFIASLNGEVLFSHDDNTFAEAGAFGLWCKPNNVTYFDDLTADTLESH